MGRSLFAMPRIMNPLESLETTLWVFLTPRAPAAACSPPSRRGRALRWPRDASQPARAKSKFLSPRGLVLHCMTRCYVVAIIADDGVCGVPSH
jgi:hypothetical protein